MKVGTSLVNLQFPYSVPFTSVVCGVRNSVTRILGGEETLQHEYPWHAAIYSKLENRPFCGCSIINNQWILTAAHYVNRDILQQTQPKDNVSTYRATKTVFQKTRPQGNVSS